MAHKAEGYIAAFAGEPFLKAGQLQPVGPAAIIDCLRASSTSETTEHCGSVGAVIDVVNYDRHYQLQELQTDSRELEPKLTTLEQPAQIELMTTHALYTLPAPVGLHCLHMLHLTDLRHLAHHEAHAGGILSNVAEGQLLPDAMAHQHQAVDGHTRTVVVSLLLLGVNLHLLV